MCNRGYEVQTIRIVQGTEYSSRTLRDYVLVKLITHVLTGRTTHGQMLFAERMKRKLTKMAFTIIIGAKLLKFWCVHGIMYSRIIINRCTTATFKNIETSYHRFFHKEGDLNICNLFVCMCLVYILC